MNNKLFNKIYYYTVTNELAKHFAIFVSGLSRPAFMSIYAIGVFCLYLSGREGMVKVIAVPFFTLLFNTILRKILNKPRPFNRDDVVKLVDHKNNGSFPSNHACSAMIISLSFIIICPVLVPCFVLFAFMTGLTRVMTGVHYPYDVICGWLISLVSGLTFFVFL